MLVLVDRGGGGGSSSSFEEFVLLLMRFLLLTVTLLGTNPAASEPIRGEALGVPGAGGGSLDRTE